jgi:predicted DNA-binding antitoxin AbrB/MazE fold protein
MTSIIIEAVYRDGVLQPQTELDLPDNTSVLVEITPLPAKSIFASSLFGAFPELATLTDDE